MQHVSCVWGGNVDYSVMSEAALKLVYIYFERSCASQVAEELSESRQLETWGSASLSHLPSGQTQDRFQDNNPKDFELQKKYPHGLLRRLCGLPSESLQWVFFLSFTFNAVCLWNIDVLFSFSYSFVCFLLQRCFSFIASQ